MSKFLILIAMVTLVGLPASVSANTSVGEGLPEKTEEITQSQDELALIKDDSTLTPEEKLQREITARIKIIDQALALSLKEVDNLRVGLSNLQFLGAAGRENELKAQFLIELDVYHKYFSDKADTLKNSADLKLEEVKALAQEIINYRDGDYNTYLKKVVDFILLAYNTEAIITTEKRLGKISSDIQKLEKLNLITLGLFQESIDKVKAMVLEAKALHNEAKLLILAVPVPVVSEAVIVVPAEEVTAPETVPAAESIDTAGTATTEPAVIEIIKPTAGELITSSLNKVKAIYEVFIQISKDIRIAVGIRN